MRGGAYFFLPGLRALRYFADSENPLPSEWLESGVPKPDGWLSPDEIAEQRIAQTQRSGATWLHLRAPVYSIARIHWAVGATPDALTSAVINWRRCRNRSGSWGNSGRSTSAIINSAALPESIGQLAQLWMLDLSSNQLMTLPESIGQLT